MPIIVPYVFINPRIIAKTIKRAIRFLLLKQAFISDFRGFEVSAFVEDGGVAGYSLNRKITKTKMTVPIIL